MAMHDNILSMVNETLPEYLIAAEQCIEFRKRDGGCLGFPATLILFAIADAVGSFYRGNSSFQVDVDGVKKKIRIPDDHFRIFNSNLYNLSLSQSELRMLVANYRNPLSHNSLLLPDSYLRRGDTEQNAFDFLPVARSTNPGWRVPFVNLVPLLHISKTAVAKFLKTAPTIVPKSRQASEMMAKADAAAGWGRDGTRRPIIPIHVSRF